MNEKIIIRNKIDLYHALQDYLAMKYMAKKIQKMIEILKAEIKDRKNSFHLPNGELSELDGPNGGITFGTDCPKEYNPDAIKDIFGESIYNITTTVIVSKESKPLIDLLIKTNLEQKKITQEQADAICKRSPNPMPRIVSVFGRAKEGTKPIIPYRTEEETNYTPLSPSILKSINLSEIDDDKEE